MKAYTPASGYLPPTALLLAFTHALAACMEVTAVLFFFYQEIRFESASLCVWISVSVLHDWFFFFRGNKLLEKSCILSEAMASLAHVVVQARLEW